MSRSPLPSSVSSSSAVPASHPGPSDPTSAPSGSPDSGSVNSWGDQTGSLISSRQGFSPGGLGRKLLPVAIVGLIVGSGVGGFGWWQSQQKAERDRAAAAITAQAATIQSDTVSAIGRIDPTAEVITLSAPPSQAGSRIGELRIQEGDQLFPGQIVAVLDTRAQLEASLERAKRQVAIARARYDQVRAGAKRGEIGSQKAEIARIVAERQGDLATQTATIARLEAERRGDLATQDATIARLMAERRTQLEAARATIARLEAERANARLEDRRYDTLHSDGAISTSQRDSKRLALQTAEARVTEARANLAQIDTSYNEKLVEARANRDRLAASRSQQLVEAQANLDRAKGSRQAQLAAGSATLDRIAEIRPSDLQAAQAEVAAAEADVRKAQADLDRAYIRCPEGGRVLKIHARPGEVVNNSTGVAEIGQTNRMDVVAEVYDSDIKKVRLGQRAKVTATAFEGELVGQVSRVGLQVRKQSAIDTDPSANLDERVVEVRITLDPKDSEKVAGLTNLQVTVTIDRANGQP